MNIQLASRERSDELPGPFSPAISISASRKFYQYCPVDSWRPPVNLYESESSYFVCADLAGMERDDIEVSVKGSVLLISGTREHPRPPWTTPDLSIHLMEIDQGPFCRSVEIPTEVDVTGIRAHYTETGYLWIELPMQT